MHQLNVCVTETFECKQTVDIGQEMPDLNMVQPLQLFFPPKSLDPPRESCSGKKLVDICHCSVNLKLMNIEG